MIITYYGASCFKIQSGETVIAFNPPSKESEYKSPRFSADIVFISTDHKDYNGRQVLSAKNDTGTGTPFVINGKGEYEIGGMHIRGLEKAGAANIIYTLALENISICHLGIFEGDLTPELKEEIGKIDVLFAPIGDQAGRAAKAAASIGAKTVIPMHYKNDQLKQFLKEFGSNGVKPIDKLTIKKKDLAEEKTEVIVLEPIV